MHLSTCFYADVVNIVSKGARFGTFESLLYVWYNFNNSISAFYLVSLISDLIITKFIGSPEETSPESPLLKKRHLEIFELKKRRVRFSLYNNTINNRG